MGTSLVFVLESMSACVQDLPEVTVHNFTWPTSTCSGCYITLPCSCQSTVCFLGIAHNKHLFILLFHIYSMCSHFKLLCSMWRINNVNSLILASILGKTIWNLKIYVSVYIYTCIPAQKYVHQLPQVPVDAHRWHHASSQCGFRVELASRCPVEGRGVGGWHD